MHLGCICGLRFEGRQREKLDSDLLWHQSRRNLGAQEAGPGKLAPLAREALLAREAPLEREALLVSAATKVRLAGAERQAVAELRDRKD